MLIKSVTLRDVGAKIADCITGRIDLTDLKVWARDAMMADSIAPHEQQEVMDLLMDLSSTTPENWRNAIKHYRAFAKQLGFRMPDEESRILWTPEDLKSLGNGR